MLVASSALYVAGPGGSDGFLVDEPHRADLDADDRAAAVRRASSSPSPSRRRCVPVHTWLPDAATEARPATRDAARRRARQGRHLRDDPVLPAAVPGGLASGPRPVVIALAVISILYGALLAIGQTDIMRLIAYTSISHFGFIVLGIFALTTVGGVRARRSTWSTTASRPRRCSSSPAMLVSPPRQQADPRLRRLAAGHAGARRDVPRGRPVRPGAARAVDVRRRVPRAGRDVPALPEAAAVIATVGIILAALYILLMYQRMMTGPKPESRRRRRRDLAHAGRSGWWRRSSPRSSCSASTRSRRSTSSTRRCDRTLQLRRRHRPRARSSPSAEGSAK